MTKKKTPHMNSLVPDLSATRKQNHAGSESRTTNFQKSITTDHQHDPNATRIILLTPKRNNVDKNILREIKNHEFIWKMRWRPKKVNTKQNGKNRDQGRKKGWIAAY